MARARRRNDPLAEFGRRPLPYLALPVTDLVTARGFYADVLGCRTGDIEGDRLEIDFFGYAVTLCRVDAVPPAVSTRLDGHEVRLPHFGLVMAWSDWHRAVDHVNYIGVPFHAPPTVAAHPTRGAEAVFYLLDPAGNCLAFRAYEEEPT